MMNFASRELSEKLQALGCKSCCDHAWYKNEANEFSVYKFLASGLPVDAGRFVTFFEQVCIAFIPQDFIGPSEQARENRSILWGNTPILSLEYGKCSLPLNFSSDVFFHHAIIDLPEDQFWVEIEKAVGERL